jgi:hypothetical protein
MNAGFNNHVSEEVLETYAMGKFSEEDCAPLEEHLLLCCLCQRRLEQTDEYLRVIQAAAWSPGHGPAAGIRRFVPEFRIPATIPEPRCFSLTPPPRQYWIRSYDSGGPGTLLRDYSLDVERYPPIGIAKTPCLSHRRRQRAKLKYRKGKTSSPVFQPHSRSQTITRAAIVPPTK